MEHGKDIEEAQTKQVDDGNPKDYIELLSRCTRNETLLSFAHSMALVSRQEELLERIEHILKPNAYFKNLLIYKRDFNKQSYELYLHDSPVMDNGENSKDLGDEALIFLEKIHQELMVSTSPILFPLEKIMLKNRTDLSFLEELDTKKIACLRLQIDKKFVGALVLLSTKNGFSVDDEIYLKHLADFISIGMSTILTKEKQQLHDKQEEERSLLLSFSNNIAAVRNKDDLCSMLNRYLKGLCFVKEYIISVKNPDQVSHRYFLYDPQASFAGLPDFVDKQNVDYPIPGGLSEAVYKSEIPVEFDIPTLLQNEKISFPTGKFWQSIGMKQLMAYPLRVGDDTLGILWIQPDKIISRLMSGMAAQIGIAIANILANAKIAAQLQEISDYKEQLQNENQYLQNEANRGFGDKDIVSSGTEMKAVFQLVSQVSFSDSTVLILGETGTGKELIARAIHNASPRKGKLMVKVNCAALPPNLIESELFGHERGSFTGATERRIGKFELANQGTLFLDEIGELPLDLQVKLLRALQEKEIERVGGRTTIKTDVRIIAATNRDLRTEVSDGRFRQDLYYRLNVFPIILPPLRERKNDIPALASFFLAKYSKNTGKKVDRISTAAMKQLMAYDWPGNVRELEHLIERSLLLSDGGTLCVMHLPTNAGTTKSQLQDDFTKSYEDNERDYIMGVLNKCNGKIFGSGGAAEILRMNVSTLNSKIKKLGIVKGKTFYRRME